MGDSDFIFDCDDLLSCKYHKKNLKRGGSYIDSPSWIKNKKATINLINDNNKCFQYAATVALNKTVRKFEKVEKNTN